MSDIKIAEKKRIEWIDVIRCIAILCVVMCHAVEGNIYSFNVEFLNSLASSSKLFAIVMFSLGRLGVPFFLMMSGYLLLDREYNDDACKRFWKDKWLGLLLATEIWIVLYNVIGVIFHFTEFSAVSMIREILLLKASYMNHMWYMPMILGMYLTLPLVANALKTVQYKTILIPYVVVLVCTFGITTADVTCNILGFGLGRTIISDGFSGGGYGLYLITGYLLKKGVLKKVQNHWLIGVSFVSFICTVLMQWCAYMRWVSYNVWYDNLFLMICAVTIFELVSRVENVPCKKVFALVSKYSFAIYLIHNPINMLLQRNETLLSMPKEVGVLCVWALTIIASWIACYLISKIPKIGKVILYMR